MPPAPPSVVAAPPSSSALMPPGALAAFAALVVTALLGAGLSAGISRAAAGDRLSVETDAIAATAAAPRPTASHASRARTGRPAAPLSERITTTTAKAASASTTTTPPTTTTTAPPPPPPPPPPLFATAEDRTNAMYVTGQGWGNGTIPPHGLADVVPGCQLLVPAAPRFHQLLLEAAWAGHHFRINDCYRDLHGQRAMRWDWCVRGSCANAAVPGYSSHGLGLAVDLALTDRHLTADDAAFAWLTQNGSRFGFRQPDWALPTGPIPEPWHWEYFGPVDRAW